MSALEFDGLGARIQADGAWVKFILPSRSIPSTSTEANAIPFAEPRKEVGAAVIKSRDNEGVRRGDSTRQWPI